MAAAVLTLLAGTAFTAFGVAPLTAVDTAATPLVTVIDEALVLPQLAEQAQALDLAPLTLYRSGVTKSSDTVDSVLRRLGVDDAHAAQFMRQNEVAARVLTGRTGKMLKAIVENGRLVELVVRGPSEHAEQLDSHFTRLTIQRQTGGGFTAHTEQAPLQVQPQVASGTISSSLFQAADEARVPDAITNQMAEIFGSDIDFRRELRKGDAFSVVYQAHTADGEPILWGGSAGKLLAARFINKGEVHDAVWFQEAGRKGAYYDLNGRSKNKAFLASPLAFSRVTSGFAMRFHPILQRWKAHLGVDYGAPTGTAVRTVGEGVVSFAGRQNGYGNVVQVQHSANRMTVYAHLSRIDVRVGEKVEQGSEIGAVGATGWATGPHLHFEFKVNGEHVDPMQIARASESTQLSPLALAQFKQMAVSTAVRLDMAEQQQVAGVRGTHRFE
jgi:murein DD-endopeptidase MepM/ murein hydrolase activator NlpD